MCYDIENMTNKFLISITPDKKPKQRFLITYALINGFKEDYGQWSVGQYGQITWKLKIVVQIKTHICYAVNNTFHLRPFSPHLEDVHFLDHWSVKLTT